MKYTRPDAAESAAGAGPSAGRWRRPSANLPADVRAAPLPAVCRRRASKDVVLDGASARQFQECGGDLDRQYARYGRSAYFFADVVEPGRVYEVGLSRAASARRSTPGFVETAGPLRMLPPEHSVRPAGVVAREADPGGDAADRAFGRRRVPFPGDCRMIPEESFAGTAAPATGCDVPDESSREAGSGLRHSG